VNIYKYGNNVDIDFEKGIVTIEDTEFRFAPLPSKLMEIFKAKGLVNYVKNK
jgi:3-isopropylmalate dehydratase small subunit